MSEETKNTGTEKETAKGCCTPETMQDFFRKMAACCSGPGEAPDCKAIMKSMKEKFCGKETEGTMPGGTKTGCGN